VRPCRWLLLACLAEILWSVSVSWIRTECSSDLSTGIFLPIAAEEQFGAIGRYRRASRARRGERSNFLAAHNATTSYFHSSRSTPAHAANRCRIEACLLALINRSKLPSEGGASAFSSQLTSDGSIRSWRVRRTNKRHAHTSFSTGRPRGVQVHVHQ
jgi:hypothetical protein